MDDLARWLSAQLDEDERIARAATPGPWKLARQRGVEWVSSAEYWAVADCSDADTARENAEHVAAWDPARVLREIDAKQRTLIRCEEEMLSGIPRLVHFAQQTVREMALSYKDAPGYAKALASFE